MKDITQKLSYGMYAVTTISGGAPKGCIANCAAQITAVPATFAVSVNHKNHTNECIKSCGKFAINVLAVDTSPALIGTFGFKSGRDTDKFKSVSYKLVDGLPVLKDSCGYITCDVIDTMETATHTVFLGRLVLSETLDDREPMTYDYYHKVIKGKAPENAPTYVAPENTAKKTENKPPRKKFVCSVCGYEYEGDELPDDLICPICGVGADKFIPL